MVLEQFAQGQDPHAGEEHPMRDFLHWDAVRDRVAHAWHLMRDRARWPASPDPSDEPGAAEAAPPPAPEPASDPPFTPTIDCGATASSIVFSVDVPGLSAEDIALSVDHNRLMISGRRRPDPILEGERLLSAERPYGAFRRWYVLPESADTEAVQSWLSEGVLTIMIPKRAAQTTRIPVGAT